MNIFLLANTDLVNDDLLRLEAVLLLLFLAHFLWHIAAHLPLDLVTHRLQQFLLNIVAHLPSHRLAVLEVGVLLGLLRSGSGLKLTPLHGLSVAVLLLNREGELVGELFAVPGATGLAVFLMDLKNEAFHLEKRRESKSEKLEKDKFIEQNINVDFTWNKINLGLNFFLIKVALPFWECRSTSWLEPFHI